MWNKISIRWQLIALLSLVVLVIEASTLFIDYYNDIKQRQNLAIEEAKTVSRSLKFDLLKAIVSPSADTFADIEFRISNYPSIGSLRVFSSDSDEIFRHVIPAMQNMDFSDFAAEEPVFSENYLHISQPIELDQHNFGKVDFVFDLSKYNTGIRELTINKIIIFAAQLVIALGLAWIISKNYTRPFTRLVNSMQQADIPKAKFLKLETRASNEIGKLYNGYNQMIEKIMIVTQELTHQSNHDSLTGLFNRRAIDSLLIEALSSEGCKNNVAMLLDIDQFKLVNDASGHLAGDELLKQLGQVITSNIDRDHHLARIGGDDFIILLRDCDQQTGIEQANKVLQAVSEFHFNWKKSFHNVSCSIGLVNFVFGQYTLKTLNIALETAFYSAKSMGQNKLSVYTEDDVNIRRYHDELQTIAIVNEALKKGPAFFELYAQSITPVQQPSEGISYEILLRLQDGKGNLVYPDLFLPAANRFQLMIKIDILVLNRYLETVCQRPDHLQKLDFVNINLGGSTLNNPDFQRNLRDAMERFDFPWNKLVLEVTETSAVGNLPQARDFINDCREKGIRVALDDFGTGMASFEYLKHLPLDIVKIDGSFVRDMLEDPIDHAMVSYASEISKLQNRQTIAEFVEEKSHFDELRKIGIDYAQGYYLDKPKPLKDSL